MNQPKRSHYRFFVDPEVILDAQVVIKDSNLIHQLSRVFRLQAGDAIVLLDNTGYEYLVTLQYVGAYEVTGRVEERHLGATELPIALTLYMPVLKGSKCEYIIEKATELGVREIVPVVYDHSIVREVMSKYDRWNAIIREAAEQSHRCVLPVLKEEISSEDVLGRVVAGNVIWCDETAGQGIAEAYQAVAQPQGDIAIIIGPEGSYSVREREMFESASISGCSLGKTVLRADTAAIMAVGIISFLCYHSR